MQKDFNYIWLLEPILGKKLTKQYQELVIYSKYFDFDLNQIPNKIIDYIFYKNDFQKLISHKLFHNNYGGIKPADIIEIVCYFADKENDYLKKIFNNFNSDIFLHLVIKHYPTYIKEKNIKLFWQLDIKDYLENWLPKHINTKTGKRLKNVKEAGLEPVSKILRFFNEKFEAWYGNSYKVSNEDKLKIRQFQVSNPEVDFERYIINAFNLKNIREKKLIMTISILVSANIFNNVMNQTVNIEKKQVELDEW